MTYGDRPSTNGEPHTAAVAAAVCGSGGRGTWSLPFDLGSRISFQRDPTAFIQPRTGHRPGGARGAPGRGGRGRGGSHGHLMDMDMG